MKRKLCGLICAVIILSITGCGETSNNNANQNDAASSVTTTNSTSSQNDNPKEKDTHKMEISNGVIYSSSNVRITATSIELGWDGYYHEFNSVYITFLVENLTNKDIKYESSTININGFEISAYDYLYFSLDANAKEYKRISISKKTLTESHIDKIESIKLKEYYMDIGMGRDKDLEKIKNAEIKFKSPYEIKWD